jgi:hypothetical protein
MEIAKLGTTTKDQRAKNTLPSLLARVLSWGPMVSIDMDVK